MKLTRIPERCFGGESRVGVNFILDRYPGRVADKLTFLRIDIRHEIRTNIGWWWSL